VQVIDCRRVLKYTYVLGFFLRDHSPEKQLFEHHQEMLEKNTERLQEYTELTLDQIDRTQVGFEVLCLCRDIVGL
jgi:membrane protein YqaA with SNARE-associated domain